MRFGVLGPLRVWTADDQPVTVPELKVRALLAALLAQEGRPVSADRLIEDLWGDRLPADPAGVLRTKVSQLRRALEDAEPGARKLVVAQAPGYALDVPADAVDAGRFQELAALARTADDPRTRASVLGDALALWRGPAFAEFADSGFARPAVVRLEERRLAALEERLNARLALGEHAALVAELADLVARHPLRERLRAAHMRALYRAGRPGEALDSYRELRERLAGELGLDPGPELTELHQRMLRRDPDLDPGPPPSRAPVTARPLPAPLTDLVGRGASVCEVAAALETGRLVTLTGPGGVGKTRLALETAGRMRAAFPDGVFLVELATLGPSAGVAEVGDLVAAALGLRDHPVPSPPDGNGGLSADRLAQALHDLDVLLLLDNCEHVVEPTAALAEALLRAAPRLRILATGQEPLAVPGERVHLVPPLDPPGPEGADDPDTLGTFSAVRLFVQRAAAASPGFRLDGDNAAAVAAICRRLDGIPLALELAAGRVRAVGVREVAARLDDRFPLLAEGRRGVPTRQRTLRAMIDWSWDLLGDPERAVLRRLAVHSGGCTLEAAERTCAGDRVAPGDVLGLLSRLVDRSLLVMTEGPEGPRYRLLETVSAYCLERLREAGESDAVHERHSRHYADLAEEADPHLRGADQRRWLGVLDAESGNLRAALRTALREEAAGTALRLVNGLSWYWYLRGRFGEARRSLDAVLDLDAPVPAAARARAVVWRAATALVLRDGADPHALTRDTLRHVEAFDDPRDLAWAQWALGAGLSGFGDAAASDALAGRALEGFEALGERWGTAAALSVRAWNAMARGDLRAAGHAAERGMRLFGELGDRWGRLQSLDNLASVAEIAGDLPRGERIRREAMDIAEDLELSCDVPFLLCGLAENALLSGDHGRAEELFARAGRMAAAQSVRLVVNLAEVGLGRAARRRGDLDAAETLLCGVLDWHRRLGYEPGTAALIWAELGFVAELRGDAPTALRRHAEGHAAAVALGDARAVALSLEGLAGAHALAGDPVRAARLLGAAAAARETAGAPAAPGERPDVDRAADRARAALGEAAFLAEYGRGGSLPAEDILEG
ncbi:BTAD domain-containing putative transcriptional regulator [Thermomonospora umbrina]|uniref:Putative ATPase n=1 Tax=Thermomonospora umbrina TaxID=111806 RepID=A0A3D9SKN9_9ACTN|nr:BTAD domain-containing putative transcriptional regulator [Thermomonospora umbrina]REE94960.1 putative ATPase [Thermomonospora umbrina]